MRTQGHRRLLMVFATLTGIVAVWAPSLAQEAPSVDFPEGTATASEVCGACHQAIYREFATGFGSDLQYRAILYQSPEGKRLLGLPANVSATATAHALAAADPFPAHARSAEEEGHTGFIADSLSLVALAQA